MIGRLLGMIIGNIVPIIGALWLGFAGGGLVYWWDRRPPATPSIHVKVLFGCCTWTAPDSLAARLEALQAAQRAAAARAKTINTQRAVAAQATGAQVHEELGRIEYVTRSVIKEIPTYVTVEDDRNFPLSVGFVRVHDAAARGVAVSDVAAPAGAADDARSIVAPSDAAAAIAANYGDCRADAAELTGWQEFYRRLLETH